MAAPPTKEGPTGPTGPTGSQGIQGLQGPAGSGTGTIVGLPYVNVKDPQFGAKGDDRNDDTGPIQAAVDYALSHAIYDVYMPEGEYATTDTIHLGYGMIGSGQNFNTVRLRGANGFSIAADAPSKAYTMIKPRFKDRPVINIQGGRGSSVKDIAIEGTALFSDPMSWTIAQRADPKSYIAEGVKDDRFAPFCGICIDGYWGNAPANPYPTPKYPSWVQSTQAYGKAPSSDTIIDRVKLYACHVGIMNQPNGDGNGDFTKTINCVFLYLKDAVGVGNTQARSNDFTNLNAYGCHTVINGRSYGTTNGMIGGKWDNMVTMGCYQLMHGSSGWVYPIAVNGLYLESGVRLGALGHHSVVHFNDCHFFCADTNFDANGNIKDFRREDFWYGNAVFRGCWFSGRTALHLRENARLEDCTINYYSGVKHGTTFSPALRRALNSFGTLICDSHTQQIVKNTYLPLYTRGHTMSENNWQQAYDGYDNYEAGVCMYGIGSEQGAVGGYELPSRLNYDIIPMSQGMLVYFNSWSVTGDTMTVDTSDRFYRPGDVLRAVGGGYVWWYIDTVDDNTVTARALTYSQFDGITYSMIADTNFNSMLYYPAGVLDIDPYTFGSWMSTTAGSADIKFVAASGAAVNRPDSCTLDSKPLWVGKHAASHCNLVPFPMGTYPKSVQAQTVTMTADALMTGVWAYAPGIKRIK